MPDSSVKVLRALMLGDVCGQPGLRALSVGLKALREEFQADVVVVNGENAANGFGLSVSQMTQMFSYGVDVITSGNHIWQQEDILPSLDSEPCLLRPANYPEGVVGHGDVLVDTAVCPVAVINLQGRLELPQIDSPFTVGKKLVAEDKAKTPVVLVDFHAEATDEKESLAFLLDGMASVVVGTHTHVQTCDEKILPGGTAYITDIGMCGPSSSVIGSLPEVSIQKQLTQMPLKNSIAENPAVITGIALQIDAETGKALSIERIKRRFD